MTSTGQKLRSLSISPKFKIPFLKLRKKMGREKCFKMDGRIVKHPVSQHVTGAMHAKASLIESTGPESLSRVLFKDHVCRNTTRESQ